MAEASIGGSGGQLPAGVAVVHERRGSPERALHRSRQALAIHAELGDLHEQVAGDLPAARAAWRQALELPTDLDRPDAGAVRATLAPA